MKTMTQLNKQHGFNLMEVVIGIAIFVIGLLALASMQGALTRTMTDAKLRSEAAAIAEQTIEGLRGFSALTATAGVFDYSDIVDGTVTVAQNNVNFTVQTDVTDYWYDLATDSMTTTQPTGAAVSEYKSVDVIVNWNINQMLRGVNADGSELSANMNPNAGEVNNQTGITLTAIIPALVTSASGKVSTESDDPLAPPPITYQPDPNLVALSLGNQRFKESTSPLPRVIRTDRLVETTFDVITYATNNSGDSTYLRREEFSTVSCECTLRAADADNPGRRPVIWAGDEYAGGHWVTKPYGVSANNQQAALCDTCCRDHHDGGSSSDDRPDTYSRAYGPFKAASEYASFVLPRTTNHKHYKLDGTTVAANGETYLEACRMVRVDGFWRVGQDFRKEDKYLFPESYLVSNSGDYSTYVTDAVAAYFNSSDTVDGYPSTTSPTPCIGDDGDNDPATNCDAVPAMQGAYDTALSAGELPTWTELTNLDPNQQLESRGIYIDYISNDLRSYLSTCVSGSLDGSGTITAGCEVGDVELDLSDSTNLLEIIPFFDVNRTYLDRWTETPAADPVDVSNQTLTTGNAHSRGLASAVNTGSSDVLGSSHRGNLGFTDTRAIDPEFYNMVTSASLNIHADTGVSPPPPQPTDTYSGAITITVNGNPNLDITAGGDANCTEPPNRWSCVVPQGSTTATVTIDGYGKNSQDRWVCDTTGTLTITAQSASGNSAYTTFQLFGVTPGSSYNLVVQASSC